MITKEYAEGLTEVLAILENTEEEYVNKIPEKVRKFFKENASSEYVPQFDLTLEIKDMDLRNETKHILSVIYMNYWAENKEEKQEFLNILNDNQNELDKEIREKYDPDKIFENTPEVSINNAAEQVSDEPVKQEESLIQYKENFFTKLVNSVKTWIQRLINKQ